MFDYDKRMQEVFDTLKPIDNSNDQIPFDGSPYNGKTPRAMHDYWRIRGIGHVLGGLFQLVDPEKYARLLNLIFQNDDDFSPSRTHVLGFTAFGTILAWNEDYQALQINMLNGWVKCRRLIDGAVVDPNNALTVNLLTLGMDASDPHDVNDKPLFPRTKKRLGTLPNDSIYGFLPILAFGGSRRLESLKIYDALAHMSILAQAQEFALMDFDPYPPAPVRLIGG